MDKRNKLYEGTDDYIKNYLMYNYMSLIEELKMSIEDIIQQTYLQHLENNTYNKSKSKFTTYLCTIAKNVVLKEYLIQNKKYKYPQYENIQNDYDEI